MFPFSFSKQLMLSPVFSKEMTERSICFCHTVPRRGGTCSFVSSGPGLCSVTCHRLFTVLPRL